MQRRIIEIGVASCVLALVVAGLSLAQQDDGPSLMSVDNEEGIVIVADGEKVIVTDGAGTVIVGDGEEAGGKPSIVPAEGGGPQIGTSQGNGPVVFGGGPGGVAQFREIRMQQMKQRLGVDDQAWKVIEPRLAKVMDLNRQVASLRGVAGPFGGGPIVVRGSSGRGASAALESATAQGRMTVANPPVANAAGPQGEQTALAKAVAQLRATVNNSSATPEDLKKQLTAVRQAWEKVKQELAAAQAELTKVLTVRQEAQLLLMGQLN